MDIKNKLTKVQNLVRSGNGEKAVLEIENILKQHPNDPLVNGLYPAICRIYIHKGKAMDIPFEWIKKGIDVDPNFGSILSKIKEANRILNEQSQKNQDKILKAKPLRLIVTITTRCNLACIMCGSRVNKINGGAVITWEAFQKIEKILPWIDGIHLGGGEPFMNPDFFKMLAICKKYGLPVETCSNGTLITDKIAQSIVKGKLDYLCISIDGVNKKTHEYIRQNSRLGKIKENIERINYYKEKYKSLQPHLEIATVLMRRNIEEVPKLVDLAVELKIKEMLAVYLSVGFKELVSESLFFHKPLANKMIREFRKKALKNNVRLSVPNTFDEDVVDTNCMRKSCIRPWDNLLINIDETFSPCNCNGMIMGNLQKDDFMDIWNGKQYQEVRSRVNTNNPVEPCKVCFASRSVQNINDMRSHVHIKIDEEVKADLQKKHLWRKEFDSYLEENR